MNIKFLTLVLSVQHGVYCDENDYFNSNGVLTFVHFYTAYFFLQLLSIWAYPKTPGFYEDTIVCCVKENPEPILFKVSAHGVRPELELDRKIVQFDRVLLHRSGCLLLFSILHF